MITYTASADELAGRVILVTGATQGLGKAVALACAAAGATVVLLAKNVKRLNAVYDEIEANGWPQPAALPIDLTAASDHELEQAVMLLRNQLGRLDGVIHCASHFTNLAPLQYQSMQDWLDVLRVNLVAVHAINRIALPLLVDAEDAAVVLTSETHGHAPKAFWGAYAVSKAGVETLCRVAADEWEMHPHLRINTLIPGPIDSPLRSKTHPAEVKATLPALASVASNYVYWVGPASRGRTGQIVDLAAA